MKQKFILDLKVVSTERLNKRNKAHSRYEIARYVTWSICRNTC